MVDSGEAEIVVFKDMGLDDRILEAISSLKWEEPTLIQEKAIPLALEGKDILARARTGSGKTAAFAIPVIQRILQIKRTSCEQEIRALMLAPSKELCKQIYKNVLDLTRFCSRDMSCVDVSGKVDLSAQRPLLLEKPDIVIGTPFRVLEHLKAENMDLKHSLQMMVIDEADLVFSFNCEADVREILKYLPQIYQSFLMSATLSPEVEAIKKLVLHNPVILKLEEPELPASSQLTQYHLKCEEEDKFVLIYAFLKLNLIRGKTLIFVNSVDRCYRLKLYLEQFGIRSCVLNSELPITSRCHMVNQFNSGIYDIIIASDEKAAEDPRQREAKKSSKKIKKDKEYGVSRGIDFQFVSNVINFDFPRSVDAYIHRVGRTARGNNKGTALSFVSSKEVPLLDEVETFFATEYPEQYEAIKPHNFNMEQLEGFRYRARDAFRAVTKIAVREARLKEIKIELLNSRKLKTYFEDNPRDLQILRHDKSLHIVKLDSHLKNVPEYIVPPVLKNLVKADNMSQKKKKPNNKRASSSESQGSKSQMKYKRLKEDPFLRL